jgi:hypothetical protein
MLFVWPFWSMLRVITDIRRQILDSIISFEFSIAAGE